MNDTVLVAMVSGFAVGAPATIAAMAAYKQAKGANRAVNGVPNGEDTLLQKVDKFILQVEHFIARQTIMIEDVDVVKSNLNEGVIRLRNVETALAHVTEQQMETAAVVALVSKQSNEAARVAAIVKEDLDAKSACADAVPPDAEVGAAADAAAHSPSIHN